MKWNQPDSVTVSKTRGSVLPILNLTYCSYHLVFNPNKSLWKLFGYISSESDHFLKITIFPSFKQYFLTKLGKNTQVVPSNQIFQDILRPPVFLLRSPFTTDSIHEPYRLAFVSIQFHILVLAKQFTNDEFPHRQLCSIGHPKHNKMGQWRVSTILEMSCIPAMFDTFDSFRLMNKSLIIFPAAKGVLHAAVEGLSVIQKWITSGFLTLHPLTNYQMRGQGWICFVGTNTTYLQYSKQSYWWDTCTLYISFCLGQDMGKGLRSGPKERNDLCWPILCYSSWQLYHKVTSNNVQF